MSLPLLTVVANGQHLTVDVTSPSGSHQACWSDAGRSSALSLPLSITADQDFYLPVGSNLVTVTVSTAAGVSLLSEVHEVGPTDHVVVTPLPAETQQAATDSAGGVESVVAGSGISVDATDPANPIVAATGGGGSAGLTILSLAFDHTMSVALLAGIPIYTPAVGDILYDAWVSVTTAFDGTTPFADIGTDFTNLQGLFAGAGFGGTEGIDLTAADQAYYGGNSLLIGYNGGVANAALGAASYPQPPTTGATASAQRFVATFTADTPLRLIATQNGQSNGEAIDSTVGSGVLYVVVGTPVAV